MVRFLFALFWVQGHSKSVLQLCPGSFNETCASMQTSWALARSGGSCLAILSLSGTERAGILNPLVGPVFLGSLEYGNLPAITTTSSGGTIFSARWLALRDFQVGGKLVYPCYKLDAAFREVCMFHHAFGSVADVCDHEYFNVFLVAFIQTYSSVIEQTGGWTSPMFFHLQYFFIFFNTLPLGAQEKAYASSFWKRYLKYSDVPEVWGPGVDVVSPKEATPAAPFNYGMPAHLVKAYYSHLPVSQSECKYKMMSWGNRSLLEMIAQSANVMGLAFLVPFSFNGNNWDSTKTNSELGSLKVLGLTISYVMVKRLLNTGKLILSSSSSSGFPFCEGGCPITDPGLLDNGPVAPVASFVSWMRSCAIPSHIHVASTASAFSLFNYYLGRGSVDMWSGAGNNMCPFPDVSYCSTLTDLRELTKRMVSDEVLHKYTELGTSYATWLPQNQFLSPFCGDPIAFDNFKASCEAKSYCYMIASLIPNSRLLISYTVQVINLLFSVLYLAPTALARSFVHDFLPQRFFNIPAFKHVAVWFPNYSLDGKEKGGMPFFKAPGHSLMDYMTFVIIRLVSHVVTAKQLARSLSLGEVPVCSYQYFQKADQFSRPAVEFQHEA